MMGKVKQAIAIERVPLLEVEGDQGRMLLEYSFLGVITVGNKKFDNLIEFAVWVDGLNTEIDQLKKSIIQTYLVAHNERCKFMGSDPDCPRCERVSRLLKLAGAQEKVE